MNKTSAAPSTRNIKNDMDKQSPSKKKIALVMLLDTLGFSVDLFSWLIFPILSIVSFGFCLQSIFVGFSLFMFSMIISVFLTSFCLAHKTSPLRISITALKAIRIKLIDWYLSARERAE